MNSPYFFVLFRLVAVLLVLLFSALPAYADGMHISKVSDTTLDATAMGPQQALLLNDSDSLTLFIQSSVQGDLQDFAWVLPLPAIPDSIDEAPSDLFQLLDDMTAPRFIQYKKHEPSGAGCLNGLDFESSGDGQEITAASDNRGEVEILNTGLVGDFSYEVVRSDEPDALVTWLNENGYRIPNALKPIMNDYIEEGFVFLAAKVRRELDSDATIDGLTPLAIRMPAGTPLIYPMRLTALSSEEPVPVLLYVASKDMPFIYEVNGYTELSFADLDDARNEDHFCTADDYSGVLFNLLSDTPGGLQTQFRQILNPSDDLYYTQCSWFNQDYDASHISFYCDSEYFTWDHPDYSYSLKAVDYSDTSFSLISNLLDKNFTLARWYGEINPEDMKDDIRFVQAKLVYSDFTEEDCDGYRYCPLQKVGFEEEMQGMTLYQSLEVSLFMEMAENCPSGGCRSIPVPVQLFLSVLALMFLRRRLAR
jgi:hypothetical protein